MLVSLLAKYYIIQFNIQQLFLGGERTEGGEEDVLIELFYIARACNIILTPVFVLEKYIHDILFFSYTHAHTHTRPHTRTLGVTVVVCIVLCMYVFMYVSMYVCINVCVCDILYGITYRYVHESIHNIYITKCIHNSYIYIVLT